MEGLLNLKEANNKSQVYTQEEWDKLNYVFTDYVVNINYDAIHNKRDLEMLIMYCYKLCDNFDPETMMKFKILLESYIFNEKKHIMSTLIN